MGLRVGSLLKAEITSDVMIITAATSVCLTWVYVSNYRQLASVHYLKNHCDLRQSSGHGT
jgi:hypothetical protein